MAGRSGVYWIKSPSAAVGSKLSRGAKAADSGLRDLAATHAARGEAHMKANAEWQDQTGFARGALYGRSDGTAIELGTVNGEYGGHLELGTSKMAARPIIWPTAQEVAPQYFEDAEQLVAAALGGR